VLRILRVLSTRKRTDEEARSAATSRASKGLRAIRSWVALQLERVLMKRKKGGEDDGFDVFDDDEAEGLEDDEIEDDEEFDEDDLDDEFSEEDDDFDEDDFVEDDDLQVNDDDFDEFGDDSER